VRNNIFDGNYSQFANTYSSVLHVLAVNPVAIDISRNVFNNNSEAQSVICSLEGSFDFSGTSVYYVDSNEFAANQAVADMRCLEANASSTMHGFYLHYNNFVDNGTTYAVYNDTPFGSMNIDADSNYWNSTNTQHVDSVIYDFYDNSGQTIVNYNPVLPFRVSLLKSCAPDITTVMQEHSDAGAQYGLSIFPNPTHNTFTISFNEWLVDNGQLTVYDIAGRCVFTDQIVHRNSYIVPQNFSPGLYFVTLSNGEKNVMRKLIIE
jgi:hypothetical protein